MQRQKSVAQEQTDTAVIGNSFAGRAKPKENPNSTTPFYRQKSPKEPQTDQKVSKVSPDCFILTVNVADAEVKTNREKILAN